MEKSLSLSKITPPEISGTRDFPFYNGVPLKLARIQWLMLMLGVALASACLTAPLTWFQKPVTAFIPVLLFVGVPLLTLKWVAGSHWHELFFQLRWRDGGWILGTAVINIIVTVLIGLLISHIGEVSSNPVFEQFKHQSSQEFELFFTRSLIQLFGEELVSILPFLALLTWFTHLKLKRTYALTIAILGTAVWFALLHLPTYNWRFLQCLLVIGSARIILLVPYLATKNIWVATGAHIVNDWLLFSILLLGNQVQDVTP